MIGLTFKISQQMLKDFQSESDYSGTLYIKGLATIKLMKHKIYHSVFVMGFQTSDDTLIHLVIIFGDKKN